MIPFNIPPYIGAELTYIEEAIKNKKICGDGVFTKKCSKSIEEKFNVQKCLLTTSGTHALEMCAFLCDIKEGDEVIMPSFTFVTSASAFVLRGAKIVFVDVNPDTMNIDEALIEPAITEKTKAIVVVHYAGISCNMDEVSEIAKKHKLILIEDAAQAVMSAYKGRALGTIGDLGVFSFHETKNYSMGEGGAILINNKKYNEQSEIIREKGTNRMRFLRGQVDKYSWVSLGSSYLPSDINAAHLLPQLESAEKINNDRLKSWALYNKLLSPLKEKGFIEIPFIPSYSNHNAHMYYIKVKDLAERTSLIEFLKQKEVSAVFHYVPLHSSEAGLKFGRFFGEDKYTTNESERLLRLPLYYGIEENDIKYVCENIGNFFANN